MNNIRRNTIFAAAGRPTNNVLTPLRPEIRAPSAPPRPRGTGFCRAGGRAANRGVANRKQITRRPRLRQRGTGERKNKRVFYGIC